MIISPRLTRAALAFLLFGTVTALLPTQDTTALADNGCLTGPPGSTGQYAIAPSSSDIRQSYMLVPTPVSYNFYFKPTAASAYTQVLSGSDTTFVVNSGQVVINKMPYSKSNQPPHYTSSSIPVAQAITRNSFGAPTGYAAADVTVTSTYLGSDLSGHQDTYTAVVTLFAPASTL